MAYEQTADTLLEVLTLQEPGIIDSIALSGLQATIQITASWEAPSGHKFTVVSKTADRLAVEHWGDTGQGDDEPALGIIWTEQSKYDTFSGNVLHITLDQQGMLQAAVRKYRRQSSSRTIQDFTQCLVRHNEQIQLLSS